MPEADAKIRKYQPNDYKLAQFVISKANLGQLAVANRIASTHWLVLSIWVAISCVFVEVMNWWPSGELYTYLKPIPAFACIALPLLYYIDWNNRPYFEKAAEAAIKGTDLVNLEEYYSRPSASGFWLLELGDRFIGLIAVDASPDGQSAAHSSETGSAPKGIDMKGDPSVATIRHFFIDEPYRPTGIQTDLLKYAVKQAFENDSQLARIEIVHSPLVPYCYDSLKTIGFQKEKELGRVGVLRWKVELYSLSRQAWQARS